MKRELYNTEYFIERASKIHNNKYGYSKVVYKRANDKVCITCPIHGNFYQNANSHLMGYGCRQCGYEVLAKLKTKKVIVNCMACNKQIKRIPSWANRNNNKFCSKKCQIAWSTEAGIFRGENNGSWKGGKAKVPCSNCGTILERNRYLLKERKNFFCSRECRFTYQSTHPTQRKHSKRIKVKCYTCGKEFEKELNQTINRKLSFCDRKCWADWRRSGAWSKENSPTYKPELSDEERYWRSHLEPTINTWTKNVKARDNKICRVCGKKNKYMIAHHLDSWNKFKELRVDLNNGVCVCKPCHDKFHKVYKRGSNTRQQFNEFVVLYKHDNDL